MSSEDKKNEILLNEVIQRINISNDLYNISTTGSDTNRGSIDYNAEFKITYSKVEDGESYKRAIIYLESKRIQLMDERYKQREQIYNAIVSLYDKLQDNQIIYIYIPIYKFDKNAFLSSSSLKYARIPEDCLAIREFKPSYANDNVRKYRLHFINLSSECSSFLITKLRYFNKIPQTRIDG